VINMSKHGISLNDDATSVIVRINMMDYSEYQDTMIVLILNWLLNDLKELKKLVEKAYRQYRVMNIVDKRLLKEIKHELWFIRHRSRILTEIFKCLTKEMEEYDKIFGEFLKEMRTRDDGKENG